MPTGYVDPEQLGEIVQTLVSSGYVNIPKAAKLLGKHPQTLHLMIDRGHIRAIKVGKRWHLTWDELKRYREQGNYTGESPTAMGELDGRTQASCSTGSETELERDLPELELKLEDSSQSANAQTHHDET